MDNSQNHKKKGEVRTMFNNISHRYDFLNHFLSFGIDHYWRRCIRKTVAKGKHDSLIDIATGTGDLAIAMAKLNPQKIIGIDISEKMLEIGIKKVEKKQLSHLIQMELGDAENINYPSEWFDVATCAFGVRNFGNLQIGLQEIYRLLIPGGRAVILEFSTPRIFPFKQIYLCYFTKILPLLGKLFSKDRHAYSYLPDSVSKFPKAEEFMEMLKRSGFKQVNASRITFGIVTKYIALK